MNRSKVKVEMGEEDANMVDPKDTGSPAQEGPEEHDDHEVEEAADCLMSAEKIKANPSLHAAAKKHLSKKKEAISKITSVDDLKHARKKMFKA